MYIVPAHTCKIIHSFWVLAIIIASLKDFFVLKCKFIVQMRVDLCITSAYCCNSQAICTCAKTCSEIICSRTIFNFKTNLTSGEPPCTACTNSLQEIQQIEGSVHVHVRLWYIRDVWTCAWTCAWTNVTSQCTYMYSVCIATYLSWLDVSFVAHG